MALPTPQPADFAIDAKDHLTTLPSELLHQICSHLLPAHKPDLAFEDIPSPPSAADHPIRQLSLTCRHLQAETNSWALHFLKQHTSVTKYKALQSSKLQHQRNFLQELLKWMAKHCIFCGKNSVRRAILVNGFVCCMKCDKEQWPNKITRTEARAQFYLKDYHLSPHRYPQPRGKTADITLTRLRYGTYMAANVQTTMFVKEEVQKLAELIHGDLDAVAKLKEREKADRKRKREEMMAKKRRMDEKRRDEEEGLNSPFARARRLGRSNEEAFQVLADLWVGSGGGLSTFD